MLEILVGDLYNLKDRSILMVNDGTKLYVAGATMKLNPLESLEEYTEKLDRIRQEITGRFVTRSEEVITLHKLFGIQNGAVSTAKEIFSDEGFADYDVFLYTPESVLRGGFSIDDLEFGTEGRNMVVDLQERHLTCKVAYDGHSGPYLAQQLRTQLDNLGEIVKTGERTLHAIGYVLRYIAKRVGDEYDSMVKDVINIVNRTTILELRGYDASQLRDFLITQYKELVTATYQQDQDQISRIRKIIDNNSGKIDRAFAILDGSS